MVNTNTTVKITTAYNKRLVLICWQEQILNFIYVYKRNKSSKCIS